MNPPTLGVDPEERTMAMAVFKVRPSDAAKLSEVTSDDVVSRQSIHTREGAALGMQGNDLYVRIQGSDQGVARAKALFDEKKAGETVPANVAEKVSKAIDAEEDAAAEGMGMIFGG